VVRLESKGCTRASPWSAPVSSNSLCVRCCHLLLSRPDFLEHLSELHIVRKAHPGAQEFTGKGKGWEAGRTYRGCNGSGAKGGTKDQTEQGGTDETKFFLILAWIRACARDSTFDLSLSTPDIMISQIRRHLSSSINLPIFQTTLSPDFIIFFSSSCLLTSSACMVEGGRQKAWRQ